jgi:hypothetical protein
MFPHCNIHKFAWPSPDRKNHNQIHHILIDRRGHSSVNLQSYRGADCDTDHYLLVANLWRHAVSKQTTHGFHVERFSLKKLSAVEGRK